MNRFCFHYEFCIDYNQFTSFAYNLTYSQVVSNLTVGQVVDKTVGLVYNKKIPLQYA